MCGIYGCIDLREGATRSREAEELIAKMGQAIEYRGPDDEGRYVRPGVAIGMRRLSIIDLEGGHQPIANEDGTVWAICNGEIYNFQELRAMLARRGHRIRSRSDTEVLVHLYEDEGTGLFKYLRGMFAFAIWDERASRLILARDRLGKKPLYLRKESHRILFASEIKSLLQDREIPRRVDPRALHEYLNLGYTPAPLTLLQGIEKLLPGHYLVVEDGRVHEDEYWEPQFDDVQAAPYEQWAERIRAKLLEAVNLRLVSDVPLGAFLSGGIDSSAIVAAMSRLSNGRVNTYSIGFEGEDSFYNELEYARIVAKTFGTNHHEIVVRPDVSELFPKLVWHLDEPMADSAFVTTYLVARLASQTVKVILSGVGGDELFGGYRRYLGDAYLRYYRLLPPSIRRVVPSLLGRLRKDRHSMIPNYVRYADAFVRSAEMNSADRYASYVTLFSDDVRACLVRSLHRENDVEHIAGVMQEYFQRHSGIDGLSQMMYVDIKTSLPDDLLLLTDKMTMAASVECRAPFLDQELVELACKVPGNLKIRGLALKYALKEAVRPWLPREIIRRRKRGFGAPVGAWLRSALKDIVKDTLSEEQVRKRGLFDYKVVQQLVSQHAEGVNDYSDHLLALVNLEIWQRLFCDGEGLA